MFALLTKSRRWRDRLRMGEPEKRGISRHSGKREALIRNPLRNIAWVLGRVGAWAKDLRIGETAYRSIGEKGL